MAISKKSERIGQARISKSGQVTIPASIRHELDVNTGEIVQFRRNAEGDILIQRAQVRPEELRGKFGPLPANMDVDDVINEAVAEAIERQNSR
jgi:AbrB family looped-hinge helix DNA binding protein